MTSKQQQLNIRVIITNPVVVTNMNLIITRTTVEKVRRDTRVTIITIKATAVNTIRNIILVIMRNMVAKRRVITTNMKNMANITKAKKATRVASLVRRKAIRRVIRRRVITTSFTKTNITKSTSFTMIIIRADITRSTVIFMVIMRRRKVITKRAVIIIPVITRIITVKRAIMTKVITTRSIRATMASTAMRSTILMTMHMARKAIINPEKNTVIRKGIKIIGSNITDQKVIAHFTVMIYIYFRQYHATTFRDRIFYIVLYII